MYPKPEKVTFHNLIVPDAVTIWKGDTSTTGIIEVVSTQDTPTGPFIPRYAMIQSTSLSQTQLNALGSPPGSQWRLLRGRWPIQHYNTIVAAAVGTYALFEHRDISGYDRQRVYLSGADIPVVAATVRKVDVWIRGNNTSTGMLVDTNTQIKFLQTQQGAPETISAGADYATSGDKTFVDLVMAFATSKGFDNIMV